MNSLKVQIWQMGQVLLPRSCDGEGHSHVREGAQAQDKPDLSPQGVNCSHGRWLRRDTESSPEAKRPPCVISWAPHLGLLASLFVTSGTSVY